MKRSICLILCLLLVLTGCREQPPENGAVFYYRRGETAFQGSDGVIAPELRDVALIGESLSALLELYCAGPVTPGLENPLPPGTAVLSHSLKDGELSLHFNGVFATLSGVDLTLTAGCLARTFLKLTGAETLILTAEGTLLNGQSSLRLTLNDLQIRDTSLDRLHRELTVYYADRERRYLVGHEITLAPGAPEELPMQLLELLLTPPRSGSLNSALPQGTRFQSAVISDGLCTVDLNPDFEGRRFYSHPSQVLSLMAMVNTLTGLPEIDRVEFTVDGQLLSRYGPLSITEPLVRDERCIGPVRTGLGEQDVTLYLSHGGDGRLLSIPVRLGRSTTVSQAELILRHLLRDSGTNGIASHIPAGTTLNAVRIEDGACFVDLSREYLNSPDTLLFSARVIAASLCTLEEVNEVQILVNGSVPADFDSKLFGPLRPTTDWFL